MFPDQIVAGDYLIRNAIKSTNYIATASGWAIMANGSAEFNDVTVRGELLVSDPDGSQVRVFDEDPGNGALIELRPANFPPYTVGPGRIRSENLTGPDRGSLIIEGPTLNGTATGSIQLTGSPASAEAYIDGDFIYLTSSLLVDINSGGGVNPIHINGNNIIDPTTFVPVMSSFTGGVAPTGPGAGGELSGRYWMIGNRRCRAEYYLLAGAGGGYGSAGNALQFTLPFTASAASLKYARGPADGTDTGTAEYDGSCRLVDTAHCRVILGGANFGATSPFVFGTAGDRVGFAVEFDLP